MATLEKWTPLYELDSMERRMRRVFEDLGFAPVATPPADVFETETEFVVELEVPGFAEEQLDVEVFHHTLRITGLREETTEKTEETLRLRQRLESRFDRRFTLPRTADVEHVHAKYAVGVLTLHVPKTATATPRKIEIPKA